MDRNGNEGNDYVCVQRSKKYSSFFLLLKLPCFNESTDSFSLWVKVFCIGIATVMAEIIFWTAILQTYSVKIDTLDQNCETS